MKKGFTLVELLAVISILMILSLIAIPNIIGMVENAKKNEFYKEVSALFSAVESYMTNNWDDISIIASDECSYISYSELVDDGLIDSINNFNAYIVFYNNPETDNIKAYIYASSDLYYVEGVRENFDKSSLISGSKDFSLIFNNSFYTNYQASVSGDVLILESI